MTLVRNAHSVQQSYMIPRNGYKTIQKNKNKIYTDIYEKTSRGHRHIHRRRIQYVQQQYLFLIASAVEGGCWHQTINTHWTTQILCLFSRFEAYETKISNKIKYSNLTSNSFDSIFSNRPKKKIYLLKNITTNLTNYPSRNLL